ncbi:acyl-CoA synthetase [Paractinoplanes brasiliensis]|uniref:Fatty-acyl-CoA synthase n=1 Tax=Paractinoplanes brasiliensis TaxID=52695 RepID=A0A4R6J8Y8_9ACTN|nr:long-chain fatty acid--CoA ligase [Actinoplanes brasiliensis]TDO31637.1 fatty-acyl-CoA synthase [Actinoplanes brasiliensis]GID30771.1 fatty-acyl-CoA synthase [Actinoplanes brasiliensis]
MRNAGLGAWPARRAAISPGRTALVFEGRRITYAELHDRVTRLAGRLREAGVDRGDRVAYLGPNHPSAVETMFATHLLGATFVPLNFRLTAPEIDYMLAHSGPKVLVYAPTSEPVVRALSTGPMLVGLVDKYEQWLVDAPRPAFDVPVDNDDPAFILYTSGTTGRPKGAVLTHGNVIWNCFNLLVGVDVAGDEVGLIGAPLFHVAALNQCLLPTFLKGGTSVIMPAWDADRALELIEEQRVTWMFGVAAMFAALTRSPRWAGADLSSVRSVMSGGASIPAALITAYEERGLTFCQGYGMTETAPGATFLEARESHAHKGSAGVPVFFADVRCVRPDLTDTEPGEPGEVLIRGPNVTPGYWEDPQATAGAFADGGWFRSGDVAVVDDEGHFHIVDRLKDMYVSGGENVYPAEVEAAVFEHPDVAEVAVVGVPDDRWGEVGRAFVVPVAGRRVDAAGLRAFLSGRLARYKMPVYVEMVPDLPRTGSGKVRKAPLRVQPLNAGTPGEL